MNEFKISVITPSYNQAQFLEETIQSVVCQNVNLEYIIIDGESNDNSVEIIRKYENQINYWTSEKDNGQAHAINKGFEKATGDIICWLNSDDLFTEDSLKKVINYFNNNNVIWLAGACEFFNKNDNFVLNYYPEFPDNNFDWLNLFVRGKSYRVLQPSVFFKREVLKTVGLLKQNFNYSFDHEFFYRIFKLYGKPKITNDILSKFRIHDSSKTCLSYKKFKNENRKIGKNNIKDCSNLKQNLYLNFQYLIHSIQ